MAFFLWGLLALGLAAVLVFSSQLEFLVPAVAALVVLALALIPGLEENYLLQTLAWLVLSGVGLVAFRNRLSRLKRRSKKLVEDAVAGRTAVVVEAIPEEGTGRVRFQGTTWTAICAEAVAEGTEVLILGQNGLVLQVERPYADRAAEEWKALEAGKKQED